MIRNILTWILYSIPIVLIVNPNGMFFPFISGKNLLFRALVDVALVLSIIIAFKDKGFRPARTWMSIAVLSFTLVVFIADIFALNPFRAFWSNFERSEGFVTIAHLTAYFFILVTAFKSNEKKWMGFWSSVLAVSVASILFAILQIYGGLVINQGGTRVDSVFGNSAYFAGFLLLSFFLTLLLSSKKEFSIRHLFWVYVCGSILYVYSFISAMSLISPGSRKTGTAWFIVLIAFAVAFFLYITKNSNNKKRTEFARNLGIGVISLLCLFLVFKTQTRGAILGVFGGLMAGSIFLLFFTKAPKNQKKIAASFLVGLLVLFVSFLAIRNSEFVKHNPTLNRLAQISWAETKTQARSIIWPMAIEGFKEHPVLGWGQEGFAYVFSKHYDPNLWGHESWFDRTHNVFLDWLVAAGIAGFLLYLSLYLLAIRASFKISKNDPASGAILVGLVLAYGFQNLFIFDNLASYIVFFALLAYLSGQVPIKWQAVKMDDGPQTNKGNSVVVAVLIALIAAAFYFSVWKPYGQNTIIISALHGIQTGKLDSAYDDFIKASKIHSTGQVEASEQFLENTKKVLAAKNVPDDMKQKYLSGAIKGFDEHIKRFPDDARALILMGGLFSEFGQYDKSRPYLEKAMQISPNKQTIYFQLAAGSLEKKDKEKTLQLLKTAYDLAPDYPNAIQQYAYGLYVFNEINEANKIIEPLAKQGIPPSVAIVKYLVESGKADTVIPLLRAAISAKPEKDLPYQLLFSVYKSIHNNAEALKIVDEMMNYPALQEKAEILKKSLDK